MAGAVRRASSLGDVTLGEYLESSGLELEDVYAGGHSWTEMRREVGLRDRTPPDQRRQLLLRAVGRLLHVDDDERLETYPRLLREDVRHRSRA